jgi:adenylyl-sulfate kinase
MTPRGFTLWFTGLSGAGKSTLSQAVAAELQGRGHRVERLDGDDFRQRLGRGLGFSKEDRDENVRRIGFVARLLSRNGAVAIAAAISPYRELRDEVRREHESRFVEIFVDCPLDVLVKRDPKGLYAKALQGEITNFSGVNDPYEAPISPEITVHTERESVGASRDVIVRWLEAQQLI